MEFILNFDVLMVYMRLSRVVHGEYANLRL